MGLKVHLDIEKVVHGGYGLARLSGQVVLVAGALEGETVEVEISEDQGILRGHMVSCVTASEERVDTFGLPPTLNLAHATYEAQLRYKRQFVQESLERIGKLEGQIDETHPSPDRWHYRNTVQYAITDEGVAYRKRKSHSLSVVTEDPVASEHIGHLVSKIDIQKLKPAQEMVIRSSFLQQGVVVTLMGPNASQLHKAAMHLVDQGVFGVCVAKADRYRSMEQARLVWGEPDLLEHYGNLELSVSAKGFAQINPKSASELYLKALEDAGSGRHALDLYGGAGPIGLHFANHYTKVTVLDTSYEGLARGQKDAKRLGIANIKYRQGDAEDLPMDIDTLVSDPPRAGMTRETLIRIGESRADRLIYISCDPATWARDAATLVSQGWNLHKVTPWDFYPQTSHVEILSLFTR